jgi:hypothetical protein
VSGGLLWGSNGRDITSRCSLRSAGCKHVMWCWQVNGGMVEGCRWCQMTLPTSTAVLGQRMAPAAPRLLCVTCRALTSGHTRLRAVYAISIFTRHQTSHCACKHTCICCCYTQWRCKYGEAQASPCYLRRPQAREHSKWREESGRHRLTLAAFVTWNYPGIEGLPELLFRLDWTTNVLVYYLVTLGLLRSRGNQRIASHLRNTQQWSRD